VSHPEPNESLPRQLCVHLAGTELHNSPVSSSTGLQTNSMAWRLVWAAG